MAELIALPKTNMHAQSNAFIHLARSAFIRGLAPLGANRAEGFFQHGLPQGFRPALDFIFTGKLIREDEQVVARVEGIRSAFVRRGAPSHTYGVEQLLDLRTAEHLAGTSSVTSRWGTFLYLCAKGFNADTILELGSCIGISTSYLASAPACLQLISIERSADVAGIAQAHVRQILPTAQIINASVDEGLDSALASFTSRLQLYYVDAFHRYEPTLRFFETAIPFLRPGALVIFDDIHWSKEMWDVWLVLRARQGFSHTIDIGRFGLCMWQGGTVKPQQFNLAKYAGWVWNYTPR